MKSQLGPDRVVPLERVFLQLVSGGVSFHPSKGLYQVPGLTAGLMQSLSCPVHC